MSILPIRHALPLLSVVLFAALSSFACNDADSNVVGPTRLVSRADFVGNELSVHPLVVRPQGVPGAQCPATPPFFAPFDLIVRADRSSSLSLNRVEMRFADTTGALAAIRTMAQSELSSLFGSTTVPAASTRTFPLIFPFGCSGALPATLDVLVFVVDSFGVERRTPLRVKLGPR